MFSRRSFLMTPAAVAALGSSSSARGGSTPAGFHLGVATYSLREFQRDLAIRTIRQLGVSYASVKDYHLPYRLSPEELQHAAGQFAKAGITIESGGVVYMLEDNDADIRRYFDYARACSMPMMVIGPTHQTVPRIEKFVKEYDIRVAIHNHGPKDKNFPTPEVALKALEGRDPRMGVCVDVGHTAATGTSPVEALRAAGARLLAIHIKDLKNLSDVESGVPVGEGAMPVVEIFQELKRMNYRGGVDLEYEIDSDNPIPGMAKSFAYMRGVLAGLAA